MIDPREMTIRHPHKAVRLTLHRDGQLELWAFQEGQRAFVITLNEDEVNQLRNMLMGRNR